MRILNSKLQALFFSILAALFFSQLSAPCSQLTFAQENRSSEFVLDVNSATLPLPVIFKPSVDLSGRGSNNENNRPQTLANHGVLEAWKKNIGFHGIYRIQFDLWDVEALAKDAGRQELLLRSYENVIKEVNDSGSRVILDIFGTPAGLGKVLDKRSAPVDPRLFKGLVKKYIKRFSCDNKLNVWYEVWNAPDLDDFFLGRKQDYLNIYRACAEAVKELEAQYKINIPIGGPSVSWWFQATDVNTIATPEKSLIYSLIRFCHSLRLPLDFVSWHAYSTDPKVDDEKTIYVKKNNIKLVRDWLHYFHFNRATPIIIAEWNFDSGANIIQERAEKANISASYIPARLLNMYKAGIDQSCFFSLEDIQDNKEGVVRNVGLFRCNPDSAKYYKVEPKAMYEAYRALAKLGKELFSSSLSVKDEFIGIIATKDSEVLAILFYNYVDPSIATSFLSRNISSLDAGDRKILLNIVKANQLNKILQHEVDLKTVRAGKLVKNMLKKAIDLKDLAFVLESKDRIFKLTIKNINGAYNFERYTIDSTCSLNCDFLPVEKREVDIKQEYCQDLTLKPYSLNLIILSPRFKEPVKTVSIAHNEGIADSSNVAVK
ncbi:MAG: cellulase family glycosylhydrolase [Candidatus Omnitrophota bacterium]